MKPTKPTKLRGILPLFMLFLLMQSCNVYHKSTYSLDEAIEKEKKITVKTNNNQTYKFNRLLKNDDSELIAEAKLKSHTAKLLQDNMVSRDSIEKTGTFKLNQADIKEIRVKNQNASTGAAVGSGLVIAGIVAGVALLIVIITIPFAA